MAAGGEEEGCEHYRRGCLLKVRWWRGRAEGRSAGVAGSGR